MPSLPALRKQLSTKLADRIAQASPRIALPADPIGFQHECVFTNDDHWQSKGLSSPVQQFPRKAYLDYLTQQWVENDRVWIDKSRDLIVTWWSVSLHLWAALLIPGIYVGYQSKDFDDANLFLENRFVLMYEQIPARFAKPAIRYNKAKGYIAVQHAGGPRSYILAIAEGGDKVRQLKFAFYFADEFAFQRWQNKTYTALRPTLDAGGKLTIVSSANGKTNLQYQIGYEELSA